MTSPHTPRIDARRWCGACAFRTFFPVSVTRSNPPYPLCDDLPVSNTPSHIFQRIIIPIDDVRIGVLRRRSSCGVTRPFEAKSPFFPRCTPFRPCGHPQTERTPRRPATRSLLRKKALLTASLESFLLLGAIIDDARSGPRPDGASPVVPFRPDFQSRAFVHLQGETS